MLGRSSGPATWIVAASTALMVWSCSTTEPHEKFDSFSQPAPGQSGAVGENLEKQLAPPGAPAAGPAGATLKPGESIWIPSGKSRVLHLEQSIRRVSIGNPDLAGIVVLGPKTIMINAKEAPRPEGTSGGGGTEGGVGAVSGKTLTPEPRFAETTLAIWRSGSEVPDIHTLSIADFVDRQVLLEVTVAELKRSAMEQVGMDFRNMSNSFISAYFMGGGAGPAPIGSSSLFPPQGSSIFPIGTNSNRPVYAFNLPNADDITGLIQYLQEEGLATILAQPKILAMSGQSAVFQVGGEIPIRIATGFSTAVLFKGFGDDHHVHPPGLRRGRHHADGHPRGQPARLHEPGRGYPDVPHAEGLDREPSEERRDPHDRRLAPDRAHRGRARDTLSAGHPGHRHPLPQHRLHRSADGARGRGDAASRASHGARRAAGAPDRPRTAHQRGNPYQAESVRGDPPADSRTTLRETDE
jgi:hypothetical protein